MLLFSFIYSKSSFIRHIHVCQTSTAFNSCILASPGISLVRIVLAFNELFSSVISAGMHFVILRYRFSFIMGVCYVNWNIVYRILFLYTPFLSVRVIVILIHVIANEDHINSHWLLNGSLSRHRFSNLHLPILANSWYHSFEFNGVMTILVTRAHIFRLHITSVMQLIIVLYRFIQIIGNESRRDSVIHERQCYSCGGQEKLLPIRIESVKTTSISNESTEVLCRK